jgi:hypothetical protein
MLATVSVPLRQASLGSMPDGPLYPVGGSTGQRKGGQNSSSAMSDGSGTKSCWLRSKAGARKIDG